MLISSVVGARPNFMKIAPVVWELKRRGIPQRLVHTGQHYDAAMSRVFFEDLGMPEPDVYLGVGSGTHRAADRARDGGHRGGMFMSPAGCAGGRR
jgi:UDP-N-acetylglucosamine 2-epimerase (non-hydrolysing)